MHNMLRGMANEVSPPNNIQLCLQQMLQRQKSQEVLKGQWNGAFSCAPPELTSLTQIEEMLISHALPVMTVYINPGGQRGYSGHCVNLPQNITELASSLPLYAKDVSVILVKMKGKNNTFKDVYVRGQKVADALNWLVVHNPCYKNLTFNHHALNLLPDNGVPVDLMALQTNGDTLEQTCPDDREPCYNDEDIVYKSKQ